MTGFGDSSGEGVRIALVSETGEAISRDALARLSYRQVVGAARVSVLRDYLQALLTSCRGNVKMAAERAGIERESMHRLIRRCGLRSDQFKVARAL